ncbi:hypothetical protein JX265_007700 [Neoarthrinium moseri]|uniref:Zn(2)-C6 fungal-type domain-containing protein n=1 Tax=Neoarthrinium moseri TaxID=1658444 RepID=A0A9P9WJ89_9PEZI|nr:hypothetical protein JX265_007700 [Neoarthrinium moseri]
MSMTGISAPRKVRKGTRSCIECRRRKLRCSWTSDSARVCRRCEERSLQCVPQTLSSPSSSQPPQSTRERVQWLEQQVAGLSKSVQALEEKQNGAPQLSNEVSPASISYEDAAGSDMSESEASIPDAAISTQPTYLGALFNNSLISSVNEINDDPGRNQPPSQLADTARALLRPLIPRKEDLAVIASRATGWLTVLNDILPIDSAVKSGDEMLARYDEVNRVTADPFTLASWLMMVALSAEHNPSIVLRTGLPGNGCRAGSEYSRPVVDAVERAIISCDRLMTTVEGIEVAILLVRLHMTRGNFKKGFLTLRRALAVAELLGLPRMVNGPKAALWRFLCIAERFQSMVLAFPSATRYYGVQKSATLFDDGGHLVPREFLFRLSDIAVNLGGPGDLHNNSPSLEELQNTVEKLDRDILALAALAPPTWWTGTRYLTPPERFMQYLYYYIRIRIHLPLVLLRNTSDQSRQSQSMCIENCRALLEAYLGLYTLLPEGNFIHWVMDLQTYTASVVLVLANHAAFSSDSEQRVSGGPQPPADRDLLARVLNAMEQNLSESGPDISKQAITSIRALTQLLEKGDAASDLGDMMLSVPLLGKLHVRRKRASESQGIPEEAIQGNPALSLPDDVFQDFETAPFSWSVEEAYDLFFYEPTQF